MDDRFDKLTYLVSLLNPNSCSSCDISPRATSGVKITAQDVYASIAMGCLHPAAQAIGLAVYRQDHLDIDTCRFHGKHLVLELFQEQEWSAFTPYRNTFKNLIRSGNMTKEYANAAKLDLAQMLPARLASLAIAELIDSGTCPSCKGTGRMPLNPALLCHACDGFGRIGYPAKKRAGYCYINEETWKKTWRARYNLIRNQFRQHLTDFDNHILRYCG